jgi:class 3 adenylate cyclase/DNA-binding beta-propeller fold protein YncE
MLRRTAGRRALTTVLFTDIVTSTETAARLGDLRWRELLRRHHAVVRRALRAHRGREMDTAGDGFFAIFRQPGEAIHCAAAVREAVAALGLQIRAGIHTGEVEPMAEKVGGLAVVIAARVLASCEPGQIRVTSTVRDLVTGSGFDFTDAGTHPLKGVPGDWHLFVLAMEAPTPAPISVEAPRQRTVSRLPRAAWFAVIGVVVAGGLAAAVFLLSSPPAPISAIANTVVRVDPQGPSIVERVAVARGPSLLATDGSGLWVASETARTLTYLPRTGDTRPVGLDGLPTGLAAAGGTVYVAQAFKHALQSFDGDADVTSTTLEGIALRRIAFDGDDGWGIDPVTDTVIHLLPGREPEVTALPKGSGAADLALDAESVWIANATNRTVTRIDRQSGEITTIGLTDQPTAIAVSDSVVWVASEIGDSLTRIDPATERALATASVCDGPVDIEQADDELWVVCSGSRQLVRVADEGTVLGSLRLQAVPSAVVVVDGSVWVALRAD